MSTRVRLIRKPRLHSAISKSFSKFPRKNIYRFLSSVLLQRLELAHNRRLLIDPGLALLLRVFHGHPIHVAGIIVTFAGRRFHGYIRYIDAGVVLVVLEDPLHEFVI